MGSVISRSMGQNSLSPVQEKFQNIFIWPSRECYQQEKAYAILEVSQNVCRTRSCWVEVMAQYLNDHCGQRLQPVTEMYLYSAFPGVQWCIQAQAGWPPAAWTRELDHSETLEAMCLWEHPGDNRVDTRGTLGNISLYFNKYYEHKSL